MFVRLVLVSLLALPLFGCVRTTRIHPSDGLAFRFPLLHFQVPQPTLETPRVRFVSNATVIPELSGLTGLPDRNDAHDSSTVSPLDVRVDSKEDLAGTLWNRSEIDLLDPEILKKDLERKSIAQRLGHDQLHFYSRDSLLNLGIIFGVGAAMANSEADAQLQKHFQASVQGATSDDWFEFLHANKELGNGFYTLPVMGAAWVASEWIDGPPAFEAGGLWGERSLRAFVVGAPPLIAMQRITGGARPGEIDEGSSWHPFRDNNGVSGHAFMSSLPFITAAKMTDDPWKKSFWYAGSTIGPLSRVNDNAHYPSQIGLGWAMAFASASAVQQTDTGKRGWTLVPQNSPTGSGVGLQYRW